MKPQPSPQESPIPWYEPRLGPHARSRLAGVLDSGYINDGPRARAFEQLVAARIGVAHGVAVSSGTAALALALMAAGVGPGDEVIVPCLTFIATANAVRLAGARPVLVEIDPVRFVLDPQAAAQALTDRTRAILPVDVNGRGAAGPELLELARTHDLAVICDSAEALGSRDPGGMLGSAGLAGCFSFSANKTISSGQGGMVVCDDAQLAARLRALKDQGRPVQGTGGDDPHPESGYNFKYTDMQAELALEQMEGLDARLALMQARERWYRSALADCRFLRFPPWDEAGGEILQWCDVLVAEGRDALAEWLAGQGIGTRAFWKPLHHQPPLRDCAPLPCPEAERIAGQGLWLPSALTLGEAELARVAEAIHAWPGPA